MVAACLLAVSCGADEVPDGLQSAGTVSADDRSAPATSASSDTLTASPASSRAADPSTSTVLEVQVDINADVDADIDAAADRLSGSSSPGPVAAPSGAMPPTVGPTPPATAPATDEARPVQPAAAQHGDDGRAGSNVDPGRSQPPSDASGRKPAGQSWTAMATFAEVTLLHPSIRIERIGFHQSNHDGARQLEPAPGAVNPLVLESRDRDTGSRTAADVVVEPGTEIRSPVTGTVIRAGGYVLYCEHHDDFVVIEPDARPGWEVKILHIDGVMVSEGDRVEAGVTTLAPAATILPFDSQVDRFTGDPSWPHVHIELVDPSIPDRPSPGGGC